MFLLFLSFDKIIDWHIPDWWHLKWNQFVYFFEKIDLEILILIWVALLIHRFIVFFNGVSSNQAGANNPATGNSDASGSGGKGPNWTKLLLKICGAGLVSISSCWGVYWAYKKYTFVPAAQVWPFDQAEDFLFWQNWVQNHLPPLPGTNNWTVVDLVHLWQQNPNGVPGQNLNNWHNIAAQQQNWPNGIQGLVGINLQGQGQQAANQAVNIINNGPPGPVNG